MNPDPTTVAKTLTPAVNAVLLATVLAEAQREEIDGYQTEILAAGSYTDSDSGERVTDPKKAWCIGDDEFPAYYSLVQAKFRAAGHDPPPECCPALIAENLQRDAEEALIELSEPFFGVTTPQLLCGTKTEGGLRTHRKFLDMLIGLCVNFPGYDAPELPTPTA